VKLAVVPVRNPLFGKIFLPSILILLGAVASPAFAQGSSDSATTDAARSVQTRIERARALAASHQLGAAAMELESLRNSTDDDVIINVTSVMLMSICLEEGNYARAASLLEETFAARHVRKEASIRTYFALAGQAVNGARSHLARYRNFGINISESTLPPEALNDLERLRSLLERMSVQAKEITRTEPRAYESLALLEDILGIRLSLARNDEDREKWEVERAGVRRGLTSTQLQVASLGTTPSGPVPSETNSQTPAIAPTPVPIPTEPLPEPSSAPKSETAHEGRTVSTGSLNLRATRRVVPVYPAIAKNSATEGTVRVYVTIDENGNVSEIARTEGPSLLRGAAEDAARRWKFSRTAVDGKLVRLSGYIEFTFAF
jgi:TonB family protein